MTLSTAERQIKRSWRKELSSSLGDTLGEMIVAPEFIPLAQQLFVLDDVKTRIGHQTRAAAQNMLLGESEYYPEILKMQRDKGSDRKSIARLIKKALTERGYDNDAITELRDRKLATHGTYQLMDVTKRETEKALLGILMNRNIWTKYLQQVKGISVLTASKLLYHVGDVTRFSQPSKLMKYSGLSVVNGEADRLRKGEECSYKPELKALLLGVIGDNFMRSNSQYRRVYDDRKKYTAEHRPEWGTNTKTKKTGYKARYHADAKRVMVKRFLIEFWKAGWLAEGLEPPTEPYAVRILGHDLESDIVSYG